MTLNLSNGLMGVSIYFSVCIHAADLEVHLHSLWSSTLTYKYTGRELEKRVKRDPNEDK